MSDDPRDPHWRERAFGFVDQLNDLKAENDRLRETVEGWKRENDRHRALYVEAVKDRDRLRAVVAEYQAAAHARIEDTNTPDATAALARLDAAEMALLSLDVSGEAT